MELCIGQLFTNNAIALLDTSIGPADTVIQVQPGLGALYPLPTKESEFFLVTLEDATAPMAREIVRISSRSGDVLTVATGGRGYEGTPAMAWPASNTIVDHRITAETLRCLQDRNQFASPTQGLAIPINTSANANSLPIDANNETCKWLVTIKTTGGSVTMFEILAVYNSGNPIYGVYSVIGNAVNFGVNVVDGGTSMDLIISNRGTSDFVKVDVIRLQHYV